MRVKKTNSFFYFINLSFCAKLLERGKDYDGVKKLKKVFGTHFITQAADCDSHAAIVMGRRVVNSKVQFLIYNSYGESCAGISSDWDCEDGKIWIDGETLAENTTRFWWFTNAD